MPASAHLEPVYYGTLRGPNKVNRRPCGCYADPVVFGHWHPSGCDGWGLVR